MTSVDPSSSSRCRALLGACFGLVIATLAGCGREESASADASADAQPAGVANLFMILPRAKTPENGVWEQSAEVEAGRNHAPLRVLRPGVTDPPNRQIELVRQAVDAGASALLVDAEDPKALAPALEEARSQGVPILLLEQDVPATGKPFHRLAYNPIEGMVQKLIDTSVEAAKSFGAPDDGPAMILIRTDQPRGPRDAARLKAMRNALESVGVKLLPDAEYHRGDNVEEFTQKVFRNEPKPAIILADDDLLFSTANRIALTQGEGNPLPVLSGFLMQPQNMSILKIGGCAAALDPNYPGFGRQAVDTGLALARGENVPKVVTVEMFLRFGPKIKKRPILDPKNMR